MPLHHLFIAFDEVLVGILLLFHGNRIGFEDVLGVLLGFFIDDPEDLTVGRDSDERFELLEILDLSI